MAHRPAVLPYVLRCSTRQLVCASLLIFICCVPIVHFSRFGYGYVEPVMTGAPLSAMPAGRTFSSALFSHAITPDLDTDCPHFLICILSAPWERQRRLRLRAEWHARSSFDIAGTAVIFVVGSQVANDPRTLQSYKQEAAEFGDLLFDEKLTDNYNNLTRKVLSALYWVSTQPWKQLQFVAKVDSDNLVSMSTLRSSGERLDPSRAEIVGKVWRGSGVIRSVHHKWYIPKEEYPFDTLPNYANGPAYVMTVPAVHRLVAIGVLKEIIERKTLRMEDVYITGILRQRLNIKLKSYYWIS